MSNLRLMHACLAVVLLGCVSPQSATSISSESASTIPASSASSGATSNEPALRTNCFTTSPDFELPDPQLIAADLSKPETCEFIVQLEGLADTSVIAGELFTSSSGASLEEQVERVRADLARGQEADILVLQLLNTGASGRNLPILDVIEIDQPNRAVVIKHESDRRSGFQALTGLVEVPSPPGEATWVIILWAISTEMNDQLIVDLINSIQVLPEYFED